MIFTLWGDFFLLGSQTIRFFSENFYFFSEKLFVKKICL